ncbi:Uncharacterised protein [Mycobacteroides abscessus subsp. abscessus]|nr:Uncharacterised protein [Mycobacteroides abscessus subsp. abscessus]
MWWNSADRISRPKPIPVLEPKYTAPIEQVICTRVTPSITAPRRAMVRVSPCATPSSMIAALTVGRYSEARVLMICNVTTTAIKPRYGRT